MTARKPFVGLVLVALLALPGCESMHDQPREEARNFNPIASASAPQEAYGRAYDALEAKNYELAKDLFQQIVSVDQDNLDVRLALSDAYLGLQESRNALTIYQSLPESERETVRVMEGMGLALLLEGRGEEAIELLQQAVERDESRWRAWNAMGLYYDSRGDWSAAEEKYRRGIEANPRSAILHNNLGYSLLLQGRPTEAEEAFGRALGLEPQLPVARANLRLALAAQGRYSAALSGVRREDLPDVLNNVGYLAMMRGDYEAAETYLSRAVEASPRYFAPAHDNLERLHVLRSE